VCSAGRQFVLTTTRERERRKERNIKSISEQLWVWIIERERERERSYRERGGEVDGVGVLRLAEALDPFELGGSRELGKLGTLFRCAVDLNQHGGEYLLDVGIGLVLQMSGRGRGKAAGSGAVARREERLGRVGSRQHGRSRFVRLVARERVRDGAQSLAGSSDHRGGGRMRLAEPRRSSVGGG